MKVKIRIALAIDASGSWCAYGSNMGKKESPASHDKMMFGCVLDAVEEGERRYIIEAEVEQPDAATPVITATAQVVE